MIEVLVYGAGGHARAVLGTLKLHRSWSVSGVIDTDFDGQSEVIFGVRVLGGVEKLKIYRPGSTSVVIAIGDNLRRRKAFIELSQEGYQLPNLIHPSAFVCETARLGEGNFIGPFAHLGPFTRLGNANIVNSYANLEHETSIGDFCHIAPSALIAGRCQIGNEVFAGAHSTVIDQLSVAPGTTIGAGSVIVKNIEEANRTFIGVPGRAI